MTFYIHQIHCDIENKNNYDLQTDLNFHLPGWWKNSPQRQ